MEADSSSGANLVRNGKNAFTWLAISRGLPLHCGVASIASSTTVIASRRSNILGFVNRACGSSRNDRDGLDLLVLSLAEEPHVILKVTFTRGP